MVVKKRLPSLGRRSPAPHHILGYGSLPDIDAKLEEFAVNPWRASERVGDTHLSNELPNLQLCLWPPTLRSRFPPVCTENLNPHIMVMKAAKDRA
jgi:hypothetical protein